MERQLDPRAAGLLKSEVEAKGIRVVLEAETAAIEGMTAVEAVRLKDGRRLAAHMVVVAIGIRPETGIAREAGLACNRGVVVDDGLETSAPGIYAIGECAEHRGQCYGLVEPGYAQARILATRLGGAETYTGSVPATNLKVSGVGVFSAGDFLGQPGTEDAVSPIPACRLTRSW